MKITCDCRNLQYREVSQEFDVLITLTDKGRRVPVVQGHPQVVFLGDSFTFGTGLSDKQTFVRLFCEGVRVRCANLGRGGSGTRLPLDILEDFLSHENWRPGGVKLFMLFMTSALMDRNDFRHNLREAHAMDQAQHHGEARFWLSTLAAHRKQLLRHSNLARVSYFYLGPLLRTLLSPAPDEAQLDAALKETARQRRRLQQLAQRYGFGYGICLRHPMQDLLGGIHRQTLETMCGIATSVAIVDTAHALLHDPWKYYYAYDGHLSPQGVRQIADLLIREDSDVSSERRSIDAKIILQQGS